MPSEQRRVPRQPDTAGNSGFTEGAGAPRRSLSRKETFPPLIELTVARSREFWRQPEAVFWTFVFPVLMAAVLGIAFRNSGPQKIMVGVEDGGPKSAWIHGALNRSPDLNAKLLPPDQASVELRTGKIAILVKSTSPDDYVYRYDPTSPESRMARLVVDDAMEKALGRADVAAPREEKVTEYGSRYIDFLIPGLLGLNLMGSGMWGLGFAVVLARTRGLLKRLMATPMRRSHYLLSFMLSRLLGLVLEVGAIVGFGWALFHVSVHGSWLSLAFISLIGAICFAGMGMLVAARPKTIEGVSGWMNLVMLPMWLVSGSFFSYSRFPEVVQPFIKALPLTALNDALRAVINEGAPLSANLGALGVLVVWGVLSFVVAVRIFRWQ